MATQRQIDSVQQVLESFESTAQFLAVVAYVLRGMDLDEQAELLEEVVPAVAAVEGG